MAHVLSIGRQEAGHIVPPDEQAVLVVDLHEGDRGILHIGKAGVRVHMLGQQLPGILLGQAPQAGVEHDVGLRSPTQALASDDAVCLSEGAVIEEVQVDVDPRSAQMRYPTVDAP